jgi:hypothetical protein
LDIWGIIPFITPVFASHFSPSSSFAPSSLVPVLGLIPPS